MRVLFATSEAWPLLKTGGLADVAYGLPRALHEEEVDIRLVLPAHPDAVARLEAPVEHRETSLDGRPLTLVSGLLPGTGVPVWLVDDPPLFARAGNPYTTEDGVPWPDNARRYYRLSRAAAALAAGELAPEWRADVLHANDWQTALAPLFLREYPNRPASLFTIHNLAYRGLFPASTLGLLGLDTGLWQPEGLEFFGELAFIKGGLHFADAVTTVSPTYAREIQTAHFGCGLDGVLRARAANLHGIVNGIDTATWNPATDPHLAARYSEPDATAKVANRTELARRVGLADGQGPVIGFIGRLVEQKGIDLLLPALARLVEQGARFAFLGSGEPHLEAGLRTAAERHPGAVGVFLGYDEGLAHLVEAGSDLFLMPSRFEPCGLNQLYSLRYGTPPIVTPTGGLADTVIDVGVDPKAGNGFHIPHLDAAALAATVERALLHWEEDRDWRGLQARGMAGDYSWNKSAAQYVSLYQSLVNS